MNDDQTFKTLLQQATSHFQAGQWPLAEQACRHLLTAEPQNASAWAILGLVRQHLGYPAEAFDLLKKALTFDPSNAELHLHLGELLRQANRFEDAARLFRRGIELQPSMPHGHNNLGLCLQELDLPAEAEACFRRAIALAPSFHRALHNLGNFLRVQNRLEESATVLREALRLAPQSPEILNSLGLTLATRHEEADAEACYRQALALRPDYAKAWLNLGNLLADRDRTDDAEMAFRRALELRPEYVEALMGMGILFAGRRQTDAALDCFRRALRQRPASDEICLTLGNCLYAEGRWDEAHVAYERTVKLNPNHVHGLARLYWGLINMCDWRRHVELLPRLKRLLHDNVRSEKPIPLDPWSAMSVPMPSADYTTLTRAFSQRYDETGERLRRRMPLPPRRAPSGRLRVGYLSHYFKHCAQTQLMGGIFSRHDRSRFEIFCYADCPSDASVRRKRLESDCEHFVSVWELSSAEAARRIAQNGIDILIALEQFTSGCRPEIVAQRVAPIQVSHMLATTSGAPFLDYFLTDRVATPPGCESFFTEAPVFLPNSYMPTDDVPIADLIPSRAACGLPERGFVYCCFNNPYKIDPEIFDVWMRILRQVPESVLWLFFRMPQVRDNLRNEAQARGIDPARLIFAEQAPHPEHLARHRHADLFLDTPLVNAITTAVDSLTAGVPVLTCPGEAFFNRAAASLVAAAELPQLVVPDLRSYEAAAIRLAQKPEELATLKQHLAERRRSCPLFDTSQYVRNLERALLAIWGRYQSGLAPAPIDLTTDDG